VPGWHTWSHKDTTRWHNALSRDFSVNSARHPPHQPAGAVLPFFWEILPAFGSTQTLVCSALPDELDSSYDPSSSPFDPPLTLLLTPPLTRRQRVKVLPLLSVSVPHPLNLHSTFFSDACPCRMLYDPKQKILYDYLGAVEDLQKRVTIRTMMGFFFNFLYCCYAKLLPSAVFGYGDASRFRCTPSWDLAVSTVLYCLSAV